MHRFVGPAAFLIVLTACGGGDSTGPEKEEEDDPDPPVATTVDISIDSAFIATGDTIAVTAIVRDQYGQTMSGQQITWSTAASATADVLANGRVVGKAAGRTTVRAAAGSVNASVPLEVFLGSGRGAPELERVDRALVAFMKQYQIPGASLAVVRDGRLVLTRGYGYADPTSQTPALPTTVFRYGSVSKPITAIAALELVEQGVLNLDDKPFEILAHLPTIQGAAEDPRLKTITLRQLLNHSGGWNANRDVDDRVWRAVWESGVRQADQLFRYGREIPLATDPGTTYAYSNYATQAVGQLIEHRTGLSYEQWVRDNILDPIGITDMQFGKTALGAREPNEARYHRSDGTRPDIDDGAMDYYGAAGSWIGRAVDLVRLVNAVEGKGGLARILQPQTITTMTARPAFYPAAGNYYGMFWDIVPEGGGLSWNHAGLADGAFADLHRLAEGTTYALVLNMTPPGPRPDLRPALRAVTSWPAHDLFALYY